MRCDELVVSVCQAILVAEYQNFSSDMCVKTLPLGRLFGGEAGDGVLLGLGGVHGGVGAAQDDMLRRRVNVRRSVTEVAGRLVWSTPKNHERRSVPFPRFLLADLAVQMEGKARDDYVFGAPAGGVLRIATFRTRVFNPAVQVLREIDEDGKPTTEWPKPTLHDLRHTAASLAISAGANVKAVQLMLGHKSAALTLDTYADLFPDDLEAVADALDAAVQALRESTADALRTNAAP